MHRIYFKNNPWPEGHPLEEFSWTAELRKDEVWFHLHLKTANYYSERDFEYKDIEDLETKSDWEHPLAWNNYHQCTISSNAWHNGGFKVCSKDLYSEKYIDGLEIYVNMNPEEMDDWDDLAFHTYLLGHDAVAKHKIKFTKTENNNFDIEWSGKIALAYSGKYDFDYEFRTKIKDVKFPKTPTLE